MDTKQEEMQAIGFFGVYREAYKIVVTWRKIFTQITFTLILPIVFFVLAQALVSEILYANSPISKHKLLDHRSEYSIVINPLEDYKLSNLSASQSLTRLRFKAASYIYLLCVSCISTSAAVYATARFFTGKKVTFKEAMISAFPNVWKRLFINFCCLLVAYLFFGVMVLIVFVCWGMLMNTSTELRASIGLVGTGVLMVLSLVGFLYIKIVWQLTDVVAVLEDVKGFQAMKRSKALTKGRMSMAIAMYFNYSITLFVVKIAFQKMFVHGSYLGEIERIGSGVVWILLLNILSLFGRVVETVFYFVCKSYHHETTDMTLVLQSDDDQLEVYLLADQHVHLKAAEDV